MKFVTIGYRDKFCVAINIFIIIKNKKKYWCYNLLQQIWREIMTYFNKL